MTGFGSMGEIEALEMQAQDDDGLSRIEGRLQAIRYSSSRGNWCVATVKGVIVVGEIYPQNLGGLYQLTGKWTEHPKYGRRFEIVSCIELVPSDKMGLVQYLEGSCPGVGRVRAREIVERYGESAIDVLRTEPGRVAEDIYGISIKTAEQISESLKSRDTWQALKIEFGKFGLSDYQIGLILKKYKAKALDELRRNPYCVEDIHGIGFKTADGIAMKMGVKPDDPRRLRAVVLYVLRESQNSGHTFLSLKQIAADASRLAQTPMERIEQAVDELVERGLLVAA